MVAESSLEGASLVARCFGSQRDSDFEFAGRAG